MKTRREEVNSLGGLISQNMMAHHHKKGRNAWWIYQIPKKEVRCSGMCMSLQLCERSFQHETQRAFYSPRLAGVQTWERGSNIINKFPQRPERCRPRLVISTEALVSSSNRDQEVSLNYRKLGGYNYFNYQEDQRAARRISPTGNYSGVYGACHLWGKWFGNQQACCLMSITQEWRGSTLKMFKPRKR